MFAPAGTPQPIINILNAEIVKIVARPEVRERFLSVSAETVGTSAAELGAMMKSDIA